MIKVIPVITFWVNKIVKVEPEDGKEGVDYEPIVDPKMRVFILLFSLVVIVLCLWFLAAYFFQKTTIFLTLVALALFLAQLFDKGTLAEAGVSLEQE